MTLSITHAFVSAKSDGVDTTLVQPSNWNAALVATMATNKILGRRTGGTGAVEELAIVPPTSTTNGYRTAPDGLITQWKRQTFVNAAKSAVSMPSNMYWYGPINITYPIPFPTVCLGMTVRALDTAANTYGVYGNAACSLSNAVCFIVAVGVPAADFDVFLEFTGY